MAPSLPRSRAKEKPNSFLLSCFSLAVKVNLGGMLVVRKRTYWNNDEIQTAHENLIYRSEQPSGLSRSNAGCCGGK